MNMVPHAARLEAGARPLPWAGDTASAVVHAATTLTAALAQGRAVDARTLRAAMEAAFGASDSAGAWVWKDAYEACEAAQVLFLRQLRLRPCAPRPHVGRHARHTCPRVGAPADPYTPLRGEPGTPAILNAGLPLGSWRASRRA